MPPAYLLTPIVETGCFFGLVALGMLVVREGAGFFNFALGPFAMLSGLGASYMVIEHDWSPWLGVLFGIATAAAGSALVERAVVRPVWKRSGRSEQATLVALVAVLFAVQQLAGWLYGRRPLPGPRLIDVAPIRWGSMVINSSAIVLVVASLATFVAVWAWLHLTASGRMLRAVGDNAGAAAVLGLPVDRVRVVAFVVAGMVAGVAGPLFAGKAGVGFGSGLDYTLFGFLALVIGGTGSIWAPLVGGLVLSAVQTLSTYWFSASALTYTTLAAAAVFFALRPEGIFATRVRT